MAITLQIKGAKELQNILDDLPNALEKKILRKALREGGRPIKDDAKQNCPVDTGELQRSIKIRALKRNRRGVVGVTVQTGQGFFKGDQYYGGFVEFGTKRMPARPFMRPAFDAQKGNAIRIIGDEIHLQLEELAPQIYRGGRVPPVPFEAEIVDTN